MKALTAWESWRDRGYQTVLSKLDASAEAHVFAFGSPEGLSFRERAIKSPREQTMYRAFIEGVNAANRDSKNKITIAGQK